MANKQNNLDVWKILVHGNPKPGCKWPFIRISKDTLIKGDGFLTLWGYKIFSIWHSMFKSSGGPLTNIFFAVLWT